MPMNTDELDEPAGQVPIAGLSSANAIGVRPGSMELPASPAAVCSRPRRDSLKRELKIASFIFELLPEILLCVGSELPRPDLSATRDTAARSAGSLERCALACFVSFHDINGCQFHLWSKMPPNPPGCIVERYIVECCRPGTSNAC